MGGDRRHVHQERDNGRPVRDRLDSRLLVGLQREEAATLGQTSKALTLPIIPGWSACVFESLWCAG